jgi:TRAP-type C4-dicarboxylate transport system permease small subunit
VLRLKGPIVRILTVSDRINGSLRSFVGIMMVGIVCLMSFEVIWRLIFRGGTIWTLEILQMMQVALPMLGCGYLLREGGHIAVSIIIERITDRNAAWLKVINSIVGVIFCVVMCWLLWDEFHFSLSIGEASPAVEVNWFPIIKLMPFIGFCLLGLQFMAEIYKNYPKKRIEKRGNWDG